MAGDLSPERPGRTLQRESGLAKPAPPGRLGGAQNPARLACPAPPVARMSGAYEGIRTAILDGVFPPGARLSQVRIADHLGLSRTPVREALRLLEKERLLTAAAGRQVIICDTSVADLDELCALRIKLDCATLRAAVPRMQPQAVAEMQVWLELMASAKADKASEDWEQAHRKFHLVPIAQAGARHRDFSAELSEQAWRYRRLYGRPFPPSHRSEIEHQALFHACASRDGGRAALVLAQHYARGALTLVAQIDPCYPAQRLRAALQEERHLSGLQGPEQECGPEASEAPDAP